MAHWRLRSLEQLVSEHAAVPLQVVSGADVTNNVGRAAYATSVGEFALALQRGMVAASDYVFTRVDNTSIAEAMPELGDSFSQVVCLWRRPFCVASRAARGSMSLILGGDGSTNGMHFHGPALNGLLSGAKEWTIERLAGAGPAWRCVQEAGDLVWVPSRLPHATLNRGVQVAAVTALFDDQHTSRRPLGVVRTAVMAGYADQGELEAVLDDGGSSGTTPLLAAAALGDAAAVRDLLATGAAVGKRDANGLAALHLASYHGHAETAMVLLQADGGARMLGAKSSDGQTPLHLAAYWGHVQAAQLLLEAGADVEATTGYDGCTPLHLAACGGRAEVVRMLLGAGAVVDAMDAAGKAPLEYAAMRGQEEAAGLLREAAAPQPRPSVLSAPCKDRRHDCLAAALRGDCDRYSQDCEQSCSECVADPQTWIPGLQALVAAGASAQLASGGAHWSSPHNQIDELVVSTLEASVTSSSTEQLRAAPSAAVLLPGGDDGGFAQQDRESIAMESVETISLASPPPAGCTARFKRPSVHRSSGRPTRVLGGH